MSCGLRFVVQTPFSTAHSHTMPTPGMHPTDRVSNFGEVASADFSGQEASQVSGHSFAQVDVTHCSECGAAVDALSLRERVLVAGKLRDVENVRTSLMLIVFTCATARVVGAEPRVSVAGCHGYCTVVTMRRTNPKLLHAPWAEAQ